MTLIFQSEDNEFAIATGRNIGNSANTSTFDSPPSSNFDLVITTNEGDSDPRLFEVGDTYDISFGGAASSTLEDAVVVRSDAAPGGGGVIVFSGVDQNGDQAQVVWSPGFDLHGWISDNTYPNSSPGFYTCDQNARYTHGFVCFAAQSRVHVPGGATRAGVLRAGDIVQTRDYGPLPLTWTGRRRQPGQGAAAPVLFLPGSIGNRAPLRLSQQHRVLVRSTKADLMFGTPEVFVPAKALINGRNIHLAPCQVITYVHLFLDTHQVLSVEGALCESLFPGDMAMGILSAADGTSGNLGATTPGTFQAARPILTYAEARVLLAGPAGKYSTETKRGRLRKSSGHRLRRRDIALV